MHAGEVEGVKIIIFGKIIIIIGNFFDIFTVEKFVAKSPDNPFSVKRLKTFRAEMGGLRAKLFSQLLFNNNYKNKYRFTQNYNGAVRLQTNRKNFYKDESPSVSTRAPVETVSKSCEL